jgi:hypothetical protein
MANASTATLPVIIGTQPRTRLGDAAGLTKSG